jgi:hypothetical protein
MPTYEKSSDCWSIVLILFGSNTLAADWLTDGGDVMRNNWQKDEKIINIKNAKDIKLVWKIKLTMSRGRCIRCAPAGDWEP